MFYIGAAIYTFGWILFISFANAEEQSWAKDLEKDQDTPEPISPKSNEIWNVEKHGAQCTSYNYGSMNVGFSHDMTD